jgi:hypothetical protein
VSTPHPSPGFLVNEVHSTPRSWFIVCGLLTAWAHLSPTPMDGTTSSVVENSSLCSNKHSPGFCCWLKSDSLCPATLPVRPTSTLHLTMSDWTLLNDTEVLVIFLLSFRDILPYSLVSITVDKFAVNLIAISGWVNSSFLWKFLLVFDTLQFHCHECTCGFLCVYPTLDSRSLIWISCLSYILGNTMLFLCIIHFPFSDYLF